MHETIESFLRSLEAERGYSPATLRTYRCALESFADYCAELDEALSWERVDADVVRRWMSRRSEEGISARTIKRDLSALRTLYLHLLRTGQVTQNPMLRVQGPRFRAELPSFVRAEQMDQLFGRDCFPHDDLGARDRLMLLTFYCTGMRCSELTGLDVERVDLSAREARVLGKRAKERIVPLTEELCGEMDHYLRQVRPRHAADPLRGPFFYSTGRGERLSHAAVWQTVHRYLSLVCTLRRRSPHVLRHTFATAMLSRGADLRAVKELLGHESLATTEIYTHVDLRDLEAAYHKAHPHE